MSLKQLVINIVRRNPRFRALPGCAPRDGFRCELDSFRVEYDATRQLRSRGGWFAVGNARHVWGRR